MKMCLYSRKYRTHFIRCEMWNFRYDDNFNDYINLYYSYTISKYISSNPSEMRIQFESQSQEKLRGIISY